MPHPFPLRTLTGDFFDPLVACHGRPVLVIFYHTDCLGCTGRALPLAYELSKAFPEVQLVVVHVEFPSRKVSREALLAVFTDGTPPFPIYLDENAFNYLAYDAEGTPHWLLFDRAGNLMHSIFGSQEGAQNRLWYGLGEVN